MIDRPEKLKKDYDHVELHFEKMLAFHLERIDAYEAFEYKSMQLQVPMRLIIDPEILVKQYQPKKIQ